MPPHTAIAFGTFDLFHLGHKSFLDQALALGGFLYVIIARDENVRKIKGKYPQWNEQKRLEKVKKKLPPNTQVALGSLTSFYEPIIKYKPKIIVLGYDQKVDSEELAKTLLAEKLTCKIVRAKAYQENIYKTSLLLPHCL